MIYIKDGKLLVSADGKLCSTCCPEYGNDCEWCTPDPFPEGQTPKYFNVTFSGVIACEGHPWPGGANLNTTWKLQQSSGDLYCKWNYLDDNWRIYLWLYYGANTYIAAARAQYPEIAYFVRTALFGGALSPCMNEASNITNGYDIDNCDVNSYGYGGTASWIKG